MMSSPQVEKSARLFKGPSPISVASSPHKALQGATGASSWLASRAPTAILPRMHIPSESMLSYLGLAQAGLWAAKVNDDTKTVLVIKLPTDTLKWIQRGVPVNLLIGH